MPTLWAENVAKIVAGALERDYGVLGFDPLPSSQLYVQLASLATFL